MADVFEVPDIPLPPEQVEDNKTYKDEFDAAFRFAFIGTGQAGSRLAEAFYKLGYRKVCVINTTSQDLTMIDIPEENKLAICEGGAGKDPSAAKAVDAASRLAAPGRALAAQGARAPLGPRCARGDFP